MDSRLKERLIGAAVLVALGVWLIPWLLDGVVRPPESATPASLELPAESDTAPLRAQTIRLDPRAASGTVPSQGSGVAETPAATHVAAPATPPAQGAQHADSHRSGQWSVQLGSFGDAANAKRLASRVDAYGYEAAVSDVKAAGKVMHRVRVGPYATRGEAEAVASSLLVHDFRAQVVQDP
jgi:DedD protein